MAATQLRSTTLTPRSPHQTRLAHIYTDSQAAAKAIARPRRQSGQAIIRDTWSKLDDTTKGRKNPTIKIKLIWIPGHSEIQGNDRADEEAKKAAIETSQTIFPYKLLKSARITQVMKEATAQWQKEWENKSSTGRQLQHITKYHHAKAESKYYAGIESKRTASTMAQLRSGHCGLNRYLHRFNLRHSPYCECGQGKEIVEHYLLECRRYKPERKELREKVKSGKMRVDRLLGDPQLVKCTMEYVAKTRRFEES